MRNIQFENLKPRIKRKKPSNLDPLLQDIRSKLGSNWSFYQECLNEIAQAATRNQDTTAWLEQVQQLVEGREDISYSHEGVLLLLSEAGITLPGQQRVGEVKVSARTTPVSSHNLLPTLRAPSIDKMTPPPLSYLLLAPSSPFTATSVFKRRKQPNTTPGRIKMTPFDFNPLTPLSLVTSSPHNTHHFAMCETTHINTHIPAQLNSRADPVFFTDSNFQLDVEKFFGVTGQGCCEQQTRSSFWGHDEAGLVPPYIADQDDLCGWMERVGRGYEVKATINRCRDHVLTDGKEELDGLRYWLLEGVADSEAGRDGV